MRWPMCAAIAAISTAGPSNGARGWSYGDVLPYFKKQESWEGGESDYRGGSGPLTTRRSRYTDPLVDAYIEAAGQAGYPFNPDYNGEDQYGFSRMQATIRNGRRCSTAVAYLRPALARKNLTVEVNAQTARVLFEGVRAIGVEYRQGGETKIARAAKEVLLCGGTINSPQLLMLSGIGAPDELSRHDIPVKIALPGVGKNLQDHVAALIVYGRNGGGPVQKNLRLDRIALSLAQGAMFGTGFTTDLPGGLIGFLKTPRAQRSCRTRSFCSLPVRSAPRPICRRSRRRSRTPSPAASWCCARKAAAPFRSPPPIRSRIRISSRTCLRPMATGRR